MSEATDAEAEIADAREHDPIAGIFPHGLGAALAEVDEIFERLRRAAPDAAIVDSLHAWVRQRVLGDYAVGIVPPRRKRRPLPPVAGEREVRTERSSSRKTAMLVEGSFPSRPQAPDK